MIVISDLLLYLSLSFVLGTLIMSTIPEQKRPLIHVPKPLYNCAIICIPLTAFAPVMQLVVYYYKGTNLWQIITTITLTFRIGQVWLFIAALSFLLLLAALLRLSQHIKLYCGLAFTILIIMALGWSSHAASMSLWKGFMTHTAHMLAVCVWVGVLFIVSWFSVNAAYWRAFLRWYHPLALTCVTIIIIAGFMLMSAVVKPEDYVAAWAVSYGQALFIKHLLIIPLLTYACINGLLLSKRLAKNPDYNPRPWVRTESIIIFFIFAATAVLGNHSPPHNIAAIVNFEGPAPLFTWLNPGLVEQHVLVRSLQLDTLSIVLLIVAFMSLASIIVTYIRKRPAALTLISSTIFVMTSYVALMLAV